MATQLERLAKLEARQDAHEAANIVAFESVYKKVDEVEVVALESREMVTQTNTLVGQMPGQIREAIRAEGKGNRIEIRDWIIGLSVIAGPIVAVLVAK